MLGRLQYATARHHVENAQGTLAERGTKHLPALQSVGGYGLSWAILVPRSPGVLAANDTEIGVSANVGGSVLGFVQLPISHISHIAPVQSYPPSVHNSLGVSFKEWSTRENSIGYQTRPDQTRPMALLDCG
jgi:hypothetical protein